MEDFVLINKAALAAIADKVRSISGSTETMNALDIGNNLSTEVESVKESLNTFLTNMGQTVMDNDLKNLASSVATIEAGVYKTGSITPASDIYSQYSGYKITHNLGKQPKMIVFWCSAKTSSNKNSELLACIALYTGVLHSEYDYLFVTYTTNLSPVTLYGNLAAGSLLSGNTLGIITETSFSTADRLVAGNTYSWFVM